MLSKVLIPLALFAVAAFADTEFVIEDPGQDNVQVVHFSSDDSKLSGITGGKMMSGYGYPGVFSPRFSGIMGGMGMGSSGMMGSGLMGMGRTLEEYLKTYLSWLTPAQKNELRVLKNAGVQREQLVKRVADFYDGLPLMSERRDKATLLMKAACHKLSEMVFGKDRAWSLKNAIEQAAYGRRIGSSGMGGMGLMGGVSDIEDLIEEMTGQVDDVHKRGLLTYYGPFCKKVTYNFVHQLTGNKMGMLNKMMYPSNIYSSGNIFEKQQYWPYSSSNLFNKYGKFGKYDNILSRNSIFNPIESTMMVNPINQVSPFIGQSDMMDNIVEQHQLQRQMAQQQQSQQSSEEEREMMAEKIANIGGSGIDAITTGITTQTGQQQQQQQQQSKQQTMMTTSSLNNPQSNVVGSGWF